MKNNKQLSITDVSLRDGMHVLKHQYTLEQVETIAFNLDNAGVDIIEISHGDGLSGSSVNYGFAKCKDIEYLKIANKVIKKAKIAVLLIPGIGTIDNLKEAFDCGATTVRVATHCSEANISEQHIKYARKLGMDTVGFLMMSHMISAKDLAIQAKLMEEYGAECIYITDSAGAMNMDQIKDRVLYLKTILNKNTEIGIHAHNNLSLAVANSITAVNEGAIRVDASLSGIGAGAGNTPIEAIIASANLYKWKHNCDLYKLLDIADDIVRPLHKNSVQVNRESLILGYAGVYSSFLLHAKQAADRYNLSTKDILIEVGKRKLVGGQEDLIADIALDLIHKYKEDKI
jgi:4-hydroxy 2-oxovalerate aldolase